MKQKYLSISVYNGDGEVIFSKDPASLQDVTSVLMLFDDLGNEIDVSIREFDVNVAKS